MREKFPRHRDQLLPALHYIEHENGYLPEWAIEVVGWHLGIPVSEVYGAATSYTELHFERPSPTTIKVCTGLSCWLMGGQEILDAIEQRLRLKNNKDKKHCTLEETSCGFLCGMAPAIQINGTWHGRITTKTALTLIETIDTEGDITVPSL